MRVVDDVKQNWQSWIGQGLPSAIVIIGCIFAFWGDFQTMKVSIQDLKASVAELQLNKDQMAKDLNDMRLQIQRLEDQLQFQGKIIETEPHKKGIGYWQSRDGETALPYAVH